MGISMFEQLKLLMLCDIYKALKIKDEFDPDFISQAILTGNHWAIKSRYQFTNNEPISEDKVMFVQEVLDMYGQLQSSYKLLTEQEKEQLKKEAEPFGDEHSFKFPGFDGNHETDFGSICDMFKKMDQFNYIGDISLNSHMPKIEKYKNMLAIFKPLRENILPNRSLSISEIKDVMLAHKKSS